MAKGWYLLLEELDHRILPTKSQNLLRLGERASIMGHIACKRWTTVLIL